MAVGRGGLKLEAAIERFHLSSRIENARAIDIGASTGGFTEALLHHGASHVTAVDVGKGQLHPSLASDARVENLEGVHFKTLSLDVAPGPFDFFTVDVSFAAARTMLRGLAFRLRDGAEGVVLVKPQFELPDKQVRGGNVTDPQLRQHALDQVREKAESLGFTLVSHADSPVAGGSGTIEILAHLRFHGRSDKLPARGERRGSPQQTKTTSVGDRFDCFAVAAPGIEAVLAREVGALEGVDQVREVPGGVEFRGSLAVVYRANLWLRTATRVLIRLGEVEAREFARLRRRASTLPWDRFLDAAPEWHISASRCRLYHTGAVEETLGYAITDAAGKLSARESGAPLCLARGVSDRWTLSIDSSGELLHRRGWRKDATEAPLRETLAAAILALLDYAPDRPLVDPMCGAGTFAIEAAAIAMRRAPGLQRGFAFERWPIHDAALFDRIADQARAAALPAPAAPILASDVDGAAVAAARSNAERAGLAAHIEIAERPLSTITPPTTPGLLVANPPYGRRLGTPTQARRLYGELARLLRARFRDWRAGVLVPQGGPPIDRALGWKPVREHRLQNGGLRVRLVELAIRDAAAAAPAGAGAGAARRSRPRRPR